MNTQFKHGIVLRSKHHSHIIRRVLLEKTFCTRELCLVSPYGYIDWPLVVGPKYWEKASYWIWLLQSARSIFWLLRAWLNYNLNRELGLERFGNEYFDKRNIFVWFWNRLYHIIGWQWMFRVVLSK